MSSDRIPDKDFLKCPAPATPAERIRAEGRMFKYGGWKCSKGCMVCAPWEDRCHVCAETAFSAFVERAARLAEEAEPAPFQSRVRPWMLACFGEAIAADKQERCHRFLEESLELVQSIGCTAGEAHQLVDYVFGRAAGDPKQEAGGVMVTLAALCLAVGLDMHDAGEAELSRIWTKVEKIRAKQAAKPKHSPLPMELPAPAPTEEQAAESLERRYRIACKTIESLTAALAEAQRERDEAREAIRGLAADARAVLRGRANNPT